MLRILSLVLTVIIIIGGVILYLGYRTDPKYTESMTFQVSYPVEHAWQELINIKEAPARKKDVESVEIIEEYGKLIAWQENLKNGGYRIYRMNKRDENRQLILELTESSYELKGIWTFDLRPRSNETEITISEESSLTDIKILGYRVLMGRDHDLLMWQKYIRVGLMESLLKRI